MRYIYTFLNPKSISLSFAEFHNSGSQ